LYGVLYKQTKKKTWRRANESEANTLLIHKKKDALMLYQICLSYNLVFTSKTGGLLFYI